MSASRTDATFKVERNTCTSPRFSDVYLLSDLKGIESQPMAKQSGALPRAEVRFTRFPSKGESIFRVGQRGQMRTDRGTVDRITVGCDIQCPKSNKIAPTQFAIYRQIEKREIQLLTLQL